MIFLFLCAGVAVYLALLTFFPNLDPDPNPSSNPNSNPNPNPNKVWNTLTGEELLTLEGHKNVVYAIAFNNPFGDKIVTGGRQP